jgi:ABC-type dipeptide/oligopeptide/nickel transport system ATPase subunit
MLEVRHLSFGYGRREPLLRHVSLSVAPREVLGLRGASGSGKSTLGRLLAGFLNPWSGTILVDGKPLPARGFSPVQMLFQTAELAVNPRWTACRILTEAYEPSRDLMETFGVREVWLHRYPHELSGGELQRVAIVRALSDRTRFIVADEISGMLDPITQAEIWTALLAFAKQHRIGLLAISHDAALMERIATRCITLARGGVIVDCKERNAAVDR